MIVLNRDHVGGRDDFFLPKPPRHGITLRLILQESHDQAARIRSSAYKTRSEIANLSKKGQENK